MSDSEEDFSVDDKIVPHPWEHSTTVNHEGELSIEEYEDMQERLRIFNAIPTRINYTTYTSRNIDPCFGCLSELDTDEDQ